MSPALAKDTDIRNKRALTFIAYLVGANQAIYKGAHVMLDPSTGYLVVGADTASCIYAGIADEDVVSTTAGVKRCRVASGGLFLLNTSTTGVAFTQITAPGTAVYLLDTGTVAFIAETVNDLKVGRVAYWVDATHSWVRLQRGGTP